KRCAGGEAKPGKMLAFWHNALGLSPRLGPIGERTGEISICAGYANRTLSPSFTRTTELGITAANVLAFLVWEETVMYDKQQLMELVRELALEFGDFTLASGKKATFYLDCRRLTLDSRGAVQVAEGILERLAGRMPDAVGGMAIGADPITAAVVTLAGLRGQPLQGFS